ncbi:EI24 domain-containing protein [uncultured Piscinibacter sp.]|uniref:EI24 domain-containing protein n=1 Tax=uncultured Piscinibacter sp. TaxID=1131835 RepID=UPI0026376B9F|nr:EI24 domain-containing protein [uncultured Piscinibacter sp.]
MRLLIDSFWRAAAYCLHPRVIALSVLPLVLMVVAALGLGYLFWDRSIDAVNATLESWSLVTSFFTWLERFDLGGLKSALAPLIVVFLATPVIVVVSLLCVAVLMTPSMLHLVAERRFPALELRHGGSWWTGTLGALGASVVALLAMLISLPLWLVPPLVLVIPPLIWGWLTYRVLIYDVLSEHASRAERHEIVRRYRPMLLGMGVLAGYLGAAPSLVWASGVMFVALAPVLVPVAIWIYTLVFAFAALWFAHFALAALERLRAEAIAPAPAPSPAMEMLPPP